jgi:hypothetical protein
MIVKCPRLVLRNDNFDFSTAAGPDVARGQAGGVCDDNLAATASAATFPETTCAAFELGESALSSYDQPSKLLTDQILLLSQRLSGEFARRVPLKFHLAPLI